MKISCTYFTLLLIITTTLSAYSQQIDTTKVVERLNFMIAQRFGNVTVKNNVLELSERFYPEVVSSKGFRGILFYKIAVMSLFTARHNLFLQLANNNQILSFELSNDGTVQNRIMDSVIEPLGIEPYNKFQVERKIDLKKLHYNVVLYAAYITADDRLILLNTDDKLGVLSFIYYVFKKNEAYIDVENIKLEYIFTNERDLKCNALNLVNPYFAIDNYDLVTIKNNCIY